MPISPPATMPITWVAAPTSSETRPPYSSRERMSLPDASVPSGNPGVPAGSPAFRTLPPPGGGTFPASGYRKHAATIAASSPAGTWRERDWRSRPRARGAETARPGAAAATSLAGIVIPDPWVNCGVQQVGEQADDHHEHGEHDDDAFEYGEVAGLDRLEELLADAGQAEDLLHDDGPTEQRPDVQRHHGDQAEHRVRGRVPQQHPPAGQALGVRGHYVVLIELLEDVGAQQPGVEAADREPE